MKLRVVRNPNDLLALWPGSPLQTTTYPNSLRYALYVILWLYSILINSKKSMCDVDSFIQRSDLTLYFILFDTVYCIFI